MRMMTALVVLLVTLAFACSGSDETPSTTASKAAATPTGSVQGSGNAVDVTLQEWSINPAAKTVKPGATTFNVRNQGPNDKHEFVILKTDLAPQQLLKLKDGSADEAGAGVSSVGEIKDMGVNERQSATFNLEPGKYVFICNIVDQEQSEAVVHFVQGMYSSFTVQ